MPPRKLDLAKIARIADQLFQRQTAEDLTAIQTHFGTAYSEGQAIAQIAVEMVARIAGLDATSERNWTPIDALVSKGLAALQAS